MEILESYTTYEPAITADIILTIMQLENDNADYLSQDWEIVVEGKFYEEETSVIAIHVASSKTAATSAKTKLEMLKNFPTKTATGGDTSETFIEYIKEKIPECIYKTFITEFEDSGHLSKINSETWEILSHYGLTYQMGAIRVPFTDYRLVTNSFRPTYGEFKISVDGATEYINTYLALEILRNIQKTLENNATLTNLRKPSKASFITLDTALLRKNPVTNFWCKMLAIK